MASPRQPAGAALARLGRAVRTGCALLLAACSLAAAAKEGDAPARRAELQQLKERIESLRRELGREEESRAEAADQLKEIEETISAANRRLRDLALQETAAGAELSRLQEQSSSLEARIASQQENLGRLLHRHYLAGERDALGQMLSGSDPNQTARDLHFLKSLSRSQAELIDRLSADLAEKRELAQQAAAQRERVAALAQSQKEERAALLTQQNQRKSLLTRIADRIRAQRREIETLKRDERRLARLVEGLGRIITRPGAPRGGAERPPAQGAERPRPPPAKKGFVTLKGSLHLPIRGQLATRFGARRSEGGGSSKGLFFRSEAGSEVRSVAAGRVVFAEWLRGFGNLIIVDHGDEYLSIYGNNESLYKSVGQTTEAGEAIASAGASGGSAESGLYFELRHRGQPIDPMKWINLR